MRCSTSQFSYDKKRKVLTAEASDFGPLRDGHLIDKLTSLSDGASSDIETLKGLHITSSKTGITVRYYLARTEVDSTENETLNWIFRPVPEDVRRYPTAASTRVIIFND